MTAMPSRTPVGVEATVADRPGNLVVATVQYLVRSMLAVTRRKAKQMEDWGRSCRRTERQMCALEKKGYEINSQSPGRQMNGLHWVWRI